MSRSQRTDANRLVPAMAFSNDGYFSLLFSDPFAFVGLTAGFLVTAVSMVWLLPYSIVEGAFALIAAALGLIPGPTYY